MISVIIPVYNVAGFVRPAVESALAQTFQDIEVIVVDDGSTDGSMEMLHDFDDPRLRVLRREHGGSAAARNAGLQLACGEFVAFLDGDDLWAPQNLERQAAFLQSHPEADASFGHSALIDEEGRSLGFKSSTCSGAVNLSQLLRTNEIGNGSCLLLRREALDHAGWFDTRLVACVDIDVWLRVASLREGNIVAIPEVLTFYRRRKGQISSDWRRMESGYLMVLERLRKVAPTIVHQEEKRSRAGRYRYYARLARESSESATAARLLMTAFCWAPFWLMGDMRTWLIAMAVVCQLMLPRGLHERAVRWGQRVLGPILS